MSIASSALSELPIGAERQASRPGIAPPMRRSIAKADTPQQPSQP